MTGTLIHIPTGRLIHDDKGGARTRKKAPSEKPILDITTPDGRSIFSIRKLVEEVDGGHSANRKAA